jgi:hypothetical protein
MIILPNEKKNTNATFLCFLYSVSIDNNLLKDLIEEGLVNQEP